jgi:cytosine permease
MELATPALALRPWYLAAAPTYLGLFVWGPFFDQLWVGDLPRGRPAWLIGEAIIASLVCYALFYNPLAWWGFRTRRRLSIVAASTFGTVGSEWITGVGIGVASIVWFAVAVNYAIDSTLLGLHSCGLIERSSLSGFDLGPIAIKGPVFLCTALFWIYITGMSSLWRLTGVVVALMRVYAPVALLLLTATALWLLPNLGSFPLENSAIIANGANLLPGEPVDSSAIALILGFFAMAGLMSVDWGAVSRSGRDLVLGGVTGIVLASFWTASMALIVVAGTVASIGLPSRPALMLHDDPIALSFRWAVFHGIGGYGAGAILILFGLAALAPACYSASVFGLRLSTHWPRLRQSHWTWLGGAVALMLMATSLVDRTGWVYRGTGALFAPAVGALVGDCVRQRGRWAGFRLGLNPPGLIAWGIGCGTVVLLELSMTRIPGRNLWVVEPTAIYGLLTSAFVYWLLARMGWERPASLVDEPDVDR